TVRFDKAAGTITRRWLLGRPDVRPLQEVVAVQYPDVGLGWANIGGGDAQRGPQYQVNLVLAPPPRVRVNVCTEPTKPFVQEAARQVAAFLGVPLVEQHKNGKSRTTFPAPGGAGPERQEAFQCLTCGHAIWEDESRCPSCGWSYTARARDDQAE